MWKEFKNFIMTGNVIDFAIAVILAGAVGGVVNGFVSEIMMPIISFITGGVNFNELKVVLNEAVKGADGTVTTQEVAIMYGKWITSIINLVIIGAVLFSMMKAKNRVNPPAPPAPAPAGPTDNELLMQIRDALRK
jgi:large conductance mechanosensitive channel